MAKTPPKPSSKLTRPPAKPPARVATPPKQPKKSTSAAKPARKAAPAAKRQPAPAKRQPPAAKRQPAPPPEPKRKRGNQPHVPTDANRLMVRLLVAGGITHDRIATALKISQHTLTRHYKHEIKVGQTEIDAQAIGALVRAMRGTGKESVIAAKWWQQSRMGWSERIVIDDPAANTPMRVVVELVGEADTSAKIGADMERDTGSRLPASVLSNIELKG